MTRPVALVYRGESTEQDDDCSEPLAEFLRRSPYRFKVRIVGPDEDEDLDADSLADADLFAMPGGPDLETAYEEMKDSKNDLRSFVSRGGRYLGVCLGAYLAGHSPGFGLLPKGADTDSECEQENAQVTTDEDAIIQVDWTYSHGDKAGQTHKKQWIYFQEGPFFTNFHETDTSFVIGRYSQSGRVAATLNKFGEGWVGLIGPHPEADQSWCQLPVPKNPRPICLITNLALTAGFVVDDEDLEAPHGLRYDIGYDLLAAIMTGKAADRSLDGRSSGHSFAGEGHGQG